MESHLLVLGTTILYTPGGFSFNVSPLAIGQLVKCNAPSHSRIKLNNKSM